jgi:hypothetical protein
MAIISCNEFKRTQGSYTSKNERTYQRTFLLVSDNPNDGPVTVETYFFNQTGITPGSVYQTSTEYDLASWCKNVSASRDSDDGLNWIVTVDYGPLDSQGQTIPWLAPADIQWSFAQWEQPLEYDAFGRPIVNSAGDPFAEALTRDQSRPVLSVRQNEASFNAYLAMSYCDTVNANYFQGAAPGNVKCSNISAAKLFDQRYGYFWAVNYEFQFNAMSWDKWVLDQGYREYRDGKQVPVLINGAPISRPVLLNGSGVKVEDGHPEQAYFFRYRVYPRVPFNFIFRA